MTDISEARDIINNMVTAAWNNHGQIEYQDRILSPSPSSEECWARVTILHDSFSQHSFADGSGGKRFNRSGSLIVQIFTPPNDGLVLSDTISNNFLNTFEGASGDIFFRRSSVREIGLSGAHYQTNFTTSFLYTHLK